MNDLPEFNSSFIDAVDDYEQGRKRLFDFAINESKNIKSGSYDEDILSKHHSLVGIPVYLEEAKQLSDELFDDVDNDLDDKIESLSSILAKEADELFVVLGSLDDRIAVSSELNLDDLRKYYKDRIIHRINGDLDEEEADDNNYIKSRVDQVIEEEVMGSVDSVIKTIGIITEEREAILNDEDSPEYKERKRTELLEAEARKRQQEAIQRKRRTKQFFVDVGKIATGVSLALVASGAAKTAFKKRR